MKVTKVRAVANGPGITVLAERLAGARSIRCLPCKGRVLVEDDGRGGHELSCINCGRTYGQVVEQQQRAA